jgi:hypothetical protein
MHDWPIRFPKQDEQKFAFCIRILSRIESIHHSDPNNVLLPVYARRLMRTMIEQWDYEGPHFLMPLSNETYWQIQVMRMWRPMGLLHLMTHQWAMKEFTEWVCLAKPFVF